LHKGLPRTPPAGISSNNFLRTVPTELRSRHLGLGLVDRGGLFFWSRQVASSNVGFAFIDELSKDMSTEGNFRLNMDLGREQGC